MANLFLNVYTRILISSRLCNLYSANNPHKFVFLNIICLIESNYLNLRSFRNNSLSVVQDKTMQLFFSSIIKRGPRCKYFR